MTGNSTNLIIFTSENHSQQTLGCYGHPLVRTPNLDRLAERGTRFTNAYCASPICCPARASIATGLYPHQTGYWENSLPYDGRVRTWMHDLRDRGHEVTSVGKLHFRRTEDDNGFSEEILPMHVVDGVGGLLGLLRGSDEEPVRAGNWEMYATDIGPGGTKYQEYDRQITTHAIRWLKEHARPAATPWVLCVNHVSGHPPFRAAKELLDLYPVDRVPLPDAWRPAERPHHPAIQHLRYILGTHDDLDEATMRRIVAGYLAVTTYLDQQIGEVLRAADDLGLLERTRVIYTSDHGDCVGSHYIFGKFNLYEPAAAVPLIMAGPSIPQGRQVDQIASHVDLYPTILDAMGYGQESTLRDKPGVSLWPAMAGQTAPRLGFAEYHALGSRNASYMLRDGHLKLIYHVGMPAQLFDLAADPHELHDLADETSYAAQKANLEAELRAILDPEETDARAKADQRRKAAEFGGKDAILKRGGFPFTPPPGVAPTFLPVAEA